MKRVIKRLVLGIVALVVVAGAALGIYVAVQTSAFDTSMAKVYAVPLPTIARSTDGAVLARGKHLVESLGGCATRDCHGTDLGGGNPLSLGPIGTLSGPNITPGGLGAAYGDGELARLVKHGIKKDGRSLRFMPTQDVSWIPDADVAAIVSYLRTVPAVDRPNGIVQIGTLGKVLDRREQFILDVARRIDHASTEQVPPPSPTADYGRFLGRGCMGCHGDRLSGGAIPGAPPSTPIPPNITAHETGLKDWGYEDFDRMLTTGVRKNGRKLDPFMPYEAFAKLDDVEKKALWAYLRSVPPTPTGNR